MKRNPELRNIPVWILPNIGRLQKVRDTKFDTIVSNKDLIKDAKCQGYNFYCFWVIKGKSTEEGLRGKSTFCTQILRNSIARTRTCDDFSKKITVLESIFKRVCSNTEVDQLENRRINEAIQDDFFITFFVKSEA